MISYLQGKLIQKNPTNILVDVNSVGYHINISLQTFENLPNQNDTVKIHTILITREDAMLLYGFATEDEKKMFELLISVSGIGPKVAQSILSGIKTDELKEHIIQGNIFALTNIPGVGRKTAERLVVELKDKLGKVDFTHVIGDVDTENIRLQAFQAMLTLGYQRQSAEKAIRSALADLNKSELTVENLIKKTLQFLNK